MSDENTSSRQLMAGTADLLNTLPADIGPVRRAIFASLRTGQVLAPEEIAARCALAVDDIQQRLAMLEAIGIAQRDEQGRIIAADGLSTIPTRHDLLLDGVPLHTWCAIDAIAIPAALGADATATTTCPSCGTQLEIAFHRGDPDAAHDLMAWLPAKSCSNIVEDFCPEANLFCNDEHLEAWRTNHGQPAGRALSIARVIEEGRRVWEQLVENR